MKYATTPVPGLTVVRQGKTRELYETKDPRYLLVVASDRLSTHNIVHLTPVPMKGYVLTALSLFWMTEVFEPAGMETHLMAYGRAVYDFLPPCDSYPHDLHLRSVVVKRVALPPVEFVLRRYNAGSLFQALSRGENQYGIRVASYTPLMRRFEEVQLTPTEKSDTDAPLSTESVRAKYPRACEAAHRAFLCAERVLARAGLALVDSKFEVGEQGVLADEVVTPDSSRICERTAVQEGRDPPWFDKQIARAFAESVWGGGTRAALQMPPHVVEQLRRTYVDLFARVTGRELVQFQKTTLGR